MTPLYNMPPHKVINVVLKAYNNIWLQTEERDFADELISALTRPRNTQLALTDDDKEAPKQLSDPLYQIIQVFQKNAVKTVANESIESDSLYLHYAELMARSCGPPEGEEEEEEEDEEDGGPDEANFQERETEKQHLIYCQQRLHERGAAEMVLQVISASNGRLGEMVVASLDLGISLLQGGNETVQRKMLHHLQEKRDVKFFTSLSALMQLCTVLDLDAYERSIKAETLGSNAVQAEELTAKGESVALRNTHLLRNVGLRICVYLINRTVNICLLSKV